MPGVRGVVDRHDLVEPGRRIGVERDRRGRRHAVGAAAHVGNDDFVAEPVHLGELGRAGHRAQVSAVRFRRYMAETVGELPVAGRWSGDGEDAEHDQQEEDQHDADQDARAGGRRTGQHRHAEQARHRRDDEKNEDPFDHGECPGKLKPGLKRRALQSMFRWRKSSRNSGRQLARTAPGYSIDGKGGLPDHGDETHQDTLDEGRGFLAARCRTGIGINLLVPEIAPMEAFCRDVLGADIVYADEDFAAVTLLGSVFMLHADHSYSDNPMSGVIEGVEQRGTGIEIRIYGLDPDVVEARAREQGHHVLAGSLDKPHGLQRMPYRRPELLCLRAEPGDRRLNLPPRRSDCRNYWDILQQFSSQTVF